MLRTTRGIWQDYTLERDTDQSEQVNSCQPLSPSLALNPFYFSNGGVNSVKEIYPSFLKLDQHGSLMCFGMSLSTLKRG